MKRVFNRTYLTLLAAFVMISAYGCAGSWHDVDQGFIKTSGVMIEAEDGSFLLRSGKLFKPPFQSKGTYWAEKPPTALSYKAECNGCRNVRVIVPGRKNALYGVLRLDKVAVGSSGPGSVSYYIKIGPQYIKEATDGNVTVLYEKVKNDTRGWQTGWVLWLSDMPLGYTE